MANVEIDHQERAEGHSGYNFKKLFGLWMNGFTAFSEKPLRMSTFAGMICYYTKDPASGSVSRI